MSKSKEEKLEDAVKIIQAFSKDSYLTGAKYLRSCAELNLTNDFFNIMYSDLRNVFKGSEEVEKFITALQNVRALCLEDTNATKYVKDQADRMAEIAATKNFFTEKYAKKEDKDKGGCRIM